jgi:F-type H+-transporting ATPase subunit a
MRPDLAVVASISQIKVGEHPSKAGLNIDTVGTTVLAAVVVLALGFYVARRASIGRPSKIQIAWEVLLNYVGDLVEQNLGPQYRRVTPVGVTIFALVLVANWVEILPGLFHNTDFLPSPTADVNLCYALAAYVLVVTNFAAFRARGFVGFFGRFFAKPRFMFPIRMIEEIANPVSLALRLFGNLFAGGIMIQLLIAFPIIAFVPSLAFTIVWKLFDMFIGVVQAFIFALLTILYYQFATDTSGSH